MISRRDFLKTSALATAGMAVGMGKANAETILGTAPRPVSANEKVKLAVIGIGNRGAQDIQGFDATGLVDIVALCDVDLKGRQCEKVLADHPNAVTCTDYRELFEKYGDRFEAVCIATPDHAHFAPAMIAMSEGKHVYVEKPMCRTFFEAELMMAAAAKRPNLVTQIGNQGHSDANYYQFKAWKEGGIYDDVKKVDIHMNQNRRWHNYDPTIHKLPDPEPMPEGINWDMWLGPTNWHDYSEKYHQGNWRCWYGLGMGALGDWAMHLMDTIYEFLELGMPYEVALVDSDKHNEFFYPYASTIKFKFGARNGMPPVELTWWDGQQNQPPLPEGYGTAQRTANVPTTNQGPVRNMGLPAGSIVYAKDYTIKRGSHGAIAHLIPDSLDQEMENKLPKYDDPKRDHYVNFCNAIRGMERAQSAFNGPMGQLSQVLCLGVIAQRLNADLFFDQYNKKFTNNAFANSMIAAEPPRKGWEWVYNL